MSRTQFSLTPLHGSFGMIIEAEAGGSIQDLPPEEIISLFKQYGALVFRNFEVNADTFLQFSSLYCKDFSSYQGGAFRLGPLDRQRVNNHETLLTVTGPTKCYAIPLHGEMYYARKRPSILWFFCENPPARDGETIICDGTAIYRNMSPEVKAFFERNPLRYLRHLTLDQWRDAFQTDDVDVVRKWCSENDATLVVDEGDGSVRIEYAAPATFKNPRLREDVFINPLFIVYHYEQAVRSGLAAEVLGDAFGHSCPIVVRLEDGSEVPETLLNEVEETAAGLTADVSWRGGDVLMIDNTRVLHGRREYLGADRSIYYRAGDPAFDF